jgi:hypothetical protein
MSLLNFLLLFRCVFEAMLMVKVNLGFHKLFCIKYMFVLGFSHHICMDLVALFIFFNLYVWFMFLGVFMVF